MKAHFGVIEQTQGLHLQAKFHLNEFIVSASDGQKPQFWESFDIFGGSCNHPLLPMRAKFGVLEQTRSTFTCETSQVNVRGSIGIFCRSVYSVVLWLRKTPIFAVFFHFGI